MVSGLTQEAGFRSVVTPAIQSSAIFEFGMPALIEGTDGGGGKGLGTSFPDGEVTDLSK